MRNFYKFMLSAFGVGWLPLAPGTWGAAVAIIPLMPLAWMCEKGKDCFVSLATITLILTILIVIFTWIGVKGSDLLEAEWGKDPKHTVIDEMVGVWIAILGMPISWFSLIAAFVLFRFFDIAKPLGVRQLEKIGNGWGVMLDDILAGVYANIVLQILIIFL